jgi:uncharacterized protein YukE
MRHAVTVIPPTVGPFLGFFNILLRGRPMPPGVAMEIEAQARACERQAEQLEQLINDLNALRRSVGTGWTGTAGSSLGEVLEARAGAVRGAQRALRSAASQMRAAATAIAAQP